MRNPRKNIPLLFLWGLDSTRPQPLKSESEPAQSPSAHERSRLLSASEAERRSCRGLEHRSLPSLTKIGKRRYGEMERAPEDDKKWSGGVNNAAEKVIFAKEKTKKKRFLGFMRSGYGANKRDRTLEQRRSRDAEDGDRSGSVTFSTRRQNGTFSISFSFMFLLTIACVLIFGQRLLPKRAK